ncbi:MAG: SGNH/GDSL hydrolase family protein [Balneolaceae bacterium]|nr:SGNH/GDSL hydrolase family protein [Balneolaceae bacterium]
MKNFSARTTTLLTALLLMLAAGCEDYNDLNLEPVPTGNADFSSYVAVGNSITAGIQNNALYESAQQYTYAHMLARQVRRSESFSQPLISDPGIGERIELTSLDPLAVQRNQQQGQPYTQEQKPFSNLGVPGAVLVDFTNPGNQGQLKERATNPNHPAFNPFYSIVLEGSELQKDAPNVFNQLAKQEPTFVTFWMGNNDVLGYVLDGGEGRAITPPNQFSQLYQASGQALASTGADVVVYNIPDVTTIPFVFYLRLQLQQQGLIRLNDPDNEGPQPARYELFDQESGNWYDIYIETDIGPRLMLQYDFPILLAQTYVAQVQAGQVAPPITPGNAIPDHLVLDGPAGGPLGSSELEQAAGAVQQYNAAIQGVASANSFALVDINATFAQISENFQTSGGTGGYSSDGLTLRPVPGELFSFDGVHPSNRGHAAVVNETIEVINNTYGASIPPVDVSVIPEGLPQADKPVQTASN